MRSPAADAVEDIPPTFDLDWISIIIFFIIQLLTMALVFGKEKLLLLEKVANLRYFQRYDSTLNVKLA